MSNENKLRLDTLKLLCDQALRVHAGSVLLKRILHPDEPVDSPLETIVCEYVKGHPDNRPDAISIMNDLVTQSAEFDKIARLVATGILLEALPPMTVITAGKEVKENVNSNRLHGKN